MCRIDTVCMVECKRYSVQGIVCRAEVLGKNVHGRVCRIECAEFSVQGRRVYRVECAV